MTDRRRGRLQARLRLWAHNWRIFRGNRLAVIGLVLLGVFLAMLIAHPVLMGTVWRTQHQVYDPVIGYDAPITELTVVERVTDPAAEIDLFSARLTNLSAEVGDVVEVKQQPAPPSARHLLGTDPLGRDILSMVLAGDRPTFIVGLMAAVTTALVGVGYASIQAVMRGRVDGVMSRVSDALLLFPAPLVMIVLGAGSFGRLLSPFRFGLFYGLLAGASTTAIVLRSHALTVMSRLFVDAARVAGARRYHLMTHHVVPHLIPLAAVSMLTAVVGAVVANGFASYLAYGHDMLNWGAMIFVGVDLLQNLGITAWSTLLAPSVTLSLFCASFYLISLGVRDIAQPRRQATGRMTSPARLEEAS
ncbi:MAG TPA: ABC transporter permease subunit [Acidimicrobiia bacterium]|nr:ABC transporter permease subunit [Acidimicrobiia bacterium]